jgi:PPP family 3-phenylpropionic acid transporter
MKRRLAAFSAVWFAYFAAIGLFNPYAPLWFKELGFSTLAIGALASMQSWTRVIAPYVWGWLGDHSGRREELVRLAALAAVAAAGVLTFAHSDAAVTLCVLLLFLANGGIVPLSEAALSHHLSPADGAPGMDSKRYGRVRVWGSIGFIAGVVLAGVTMQRFGIDLFPQLALAMFTLLLLAALRMPATRIAAHADDAAAPRVLAVLRQPEVAWFFAALFFTVLAHTSLYAFFSLYLDSLGYGKAAVGGLWAVSVAAEIVFFWFQGRWLPRLLPQRWLEIAAAVSVLRFAATASLGASVAVLVAAQALHALSFAAQHASCILLLNRYFPGRLRGRGQALYTTLGYGISGVIGGLAGGWLSAHLGFAAVFWAATAAAALGWLCARRMRGLAQAA